ncbi:MAG: IS1634 family transposase, partial [Chitinispirillia bacterium]
YITAVTKPQIEKLLEDDVIQLSLFDEDVAEVTTPESIRYILRKNPVLATEVRNTRMRKLRVVETLVETKTEYLSTYLKAKVSTAISAVKAKISQLKLNSWLDVSNEERRLRLIIDEEKRSEIEKLDGCYVIKTDVKPEKADAQCIHERYKDLASVKRIFRFGKTVHLEVRPINVRKEARTQGHVLMVMLAMKLRLELGRLWHDKELTVEEGIKETATLCFTEVIKENTTVCNTLPEPRPSVKSLLDAARINLQTVMP